MIAIFALGLSIYVAKTPAAGPAETKLAKLEFQVEALSKLNDFEFTRNQLKSLKSLATDTAGHALPEQLAAKGPAVYETALQDLRDALIDGDDDRISDAQDKVDELRDSNNIDPDIDVPINVEARTKAVEALKLMNSSQIASYVSEHSEDVPDAAATIGDAMDQCHDAQTDFAQLRLDASEQVGLLIAGLDVSAAKSVSDRVVVLLDKAHHMSAADMKAHRHELDAQAKEITGSTDSFEQLRHWMQGEMADLLANPELNTVLSARLKASAKPTTNPGEKTPATTEE